jgi:hypothetical protein
MKQASHISVLAKGKGKYPITSNGKGITSSWKSRTDKVKAGTTISFHKSQKEDSYLFGVVTTVVILTNGRKDFEFDILPSTRKASDNKFGARQALAYEV